MNIEIESKYRVDDLADAEQKLIALGWVKKSEKHLIDTYFITEDAFSLMRPDFDNGGKRANFRLRHDVMRNTFSFELKRHIPGVSDQHDEFEVTIADAKSAETLVAILGEFYFVELCRVDKKRVSYVKNGLTVDLDSVADLGDFIEIEASSDMTDPDAAIAGIAAVADALTLDPVTKTAWGYSDLLAIAKFGNAFNYPGKENIV